MDNIIITNGCDQKTKLEYIKNNISSKFNLSLFFCVDIGSDIINDWIDKGYLPQVPEKMIVFSDECSMLLEQFTVGGSYNWGNKTYDWISCYNQNFDVILVDKSEKLSGEKGSTLKTINFFRDTWWKIKPLYIFSNETREQIQEICKDANIIEL